MASDRVRATEPLGAAVPFVAVRYAEATSASARACFADARTLDGASAKWPWRLQILSLMNLVLSVVARRDVAAARAYFARASTTSSSTNERLFGVHVEAVQRAFALAALIVPGITFAEYCAWTTHVSVCAEFVRTREDGVVGVAYLAFTVRVRRACLPNASLRWTGDGHVEVVALRDFADGEEPTLRVHNAIGLDAHPPTCTCTPPPPPSSPPAWLATAREATRSLVCTPLAYEELVRTLEFAAAVDESPRSSFTPPPLVDETRVYVAATTLLLVDAAPWHARIRHVLTATRFGRALVERLLIEQHVPLTERHVLASLL